LSHSIGTVVDSKLDQDILLCQIMTMMQDFNLIIQTIMYRWNACLPILKTSAVEKVIIDNSQLKDLVIRFRHNALVIQDSYLKSRGYTLESCDRFASDYLDILDVFGVERLIRMIADPILIDKIIDRDYKEIAIIV